VPKLIVAYIIWIIGKWGINYVVKLVDKLDVKKWDFDDKAREAFKAILVPTAKVVLILVILDTLGIGRSFVSAVISGITFAIAIALGLAFGKALEGDAKQLVENFKKHVKK
jgi:hypothetical protein